MLAAFLKVEPGEGRPLAWLVAFSFFAGIVLVSYYAASSALFLTTYGSATIPWVVYRLGFCRHDRRRNLLSCRAKVGALPSAYGNVVLHLCFDRQPSDGVDDDGQSLAGLRSIDLVSRYQWFDDGRPVDTRGKHFRRQAGQAAFRSRRWGELLASVVGGALTPILVERLGTPNLLWISGGGIVGCFMTMSVTIRFATLGHGAIGSPSQTPKETDSRVRFRDLVRSPYILAIFTVFFVGSTTNQLIDFAFYNQAEIRYADADELARFFGVFFGLSQAVTLILIMVVTGRLMGILGIHVGKVRRGALAVTLLVTIGYYFWGAGATGFFFLAAATKLTDLVCARATTGPVFPVLYQVLPQHRRIAVQVSLETIIGPIAGGVVGGILILLAWLGGTQIIFLSAGALVTIAIWHLASNRLNREYQRALSEALVSRRLEGGSMIYDESTVDILKDRLSRNHPGEVIYALDLLDKVADEKAVDFYVQLLDHSSAEVRIHVLERIRIERPSLLADKVRVIAVEGEDPSVQTQAIRTICALEQSDAVDAMAPYLEDPEEVVRRGAMAGLLRFGGIEGVLAAGQYLLRLEDSPEPSDRVFVADVLNDVGITSFYRPLLKLLRDDRHDVRRAALNAASRVRNPRLWSLMVQNLAEAQFSPYAAAALARAGEVALNPMKEILESDRYPREIKMRAASICGRIGGQAAMSLLGSRLAELDRGVRRALLSALHHGGFTAQGVDVVDVRRLLRQEVSDLAWSLSIVIDLDSDGACELLTRALTYEMTLTRHRCFLLLSFLYDTKTVLRAEENLTHSSSLQRAYALEALEEMISRDLRNLLFPVFEWSKPEDCYDAISEQFPQTRGDRRSRLQELVNEKSRWVSPWARAYAIYALSELGFDLEPALLQEALDSEDRVVRETALLASRRLSTGNVDNENKGEDPMLLTIERVLVLKSVTIFNGVPEEVLAALSGEMEEVQVAAGKAVYEKGGSGRIMYIVVSGGLKVHDGDRTFVTLNERDFFGELTTLDPAPHSATVTAVEPSTLLCLDREALYELMSDHPEVLREIIHELCERLRRKS